MELAKTSDIDAAAKVVPAGTLTHSLTNWPERELAPGLHPQMFAMFIGVYAAMMVVLWLFFGTDINAGIALAISTMYFAMYFGVPLAMLRLAKRAAPQPRQDSLGTFLAGDVDTYTGPVSGWGAMAQLLTIPIGLAFAFVAIGIISRLAS